MRLASCVPVIRDDLVHALETCGIRTDRDLLFSITSLELFQRLPSGTATLHELDQLKELVAESAAAPASTGLDLFSKEQQSQREAVGIVSDTPELDELFGSFSGPGVIHISGDRHAGKTVSIGVLRRKVSGVLQKGRFWHCI